VLSSSPPLSEREAQSLERSLEQAVVMDGSGRDSPIDFAAPAPAGNEHEHEHEHGGGGGDDDDDDDSTMSEVAPPPRHLPVAALG